MGDRYTITERVDQGGMAEVFRGVAESLQGFKKSVAIKRILPSLTKNKKFVSMFLDEARLSLHLQHANVVHVFDIGIADKAYFIVMEYVDGCNLKGVMEYLRKVGKRMTVAQAIYIMMDVCKGLAYAHAAEDPESGRPLGIVHRDISPPNILLSKNGEVKLVDFGLAKATSQLSQTDPGVVKGKFSYLSPEAATGQPIDHRADLFAVGILLWEMLTGKRLFNGDTDYQTVELVRQAKIPSARALNPDVDKDLEAVVMKSLSRDPRDRFQQAADFQDALAQILFTRAMKVTSRDISALVREVCADREKDAGKARAERPKQSLIDGLIMEEMHKFTSLDDSVSGASGPGVDEADPELSGQSPLDPRAFISGQPEEPRPPPAKIAAKSNAERPAGRKIAPTAPSTPSALKRKKPAAAGAKGETRVGTSPGDVGSLSQILEPERGNTSKQPLAEPEPARSHKLIIALVVVGVLLAGFIGLYVFDRDLFGGGPTPAPTAPIH